MIEQFRSRPRPPATTGSPGALATPGSSVTPAARQWLTDTLIAAVVTAASLAWTYSAGSWRASQGAANLAGYLLLAAGGAALIARRRYPVTVLAVTLAAALLAESAGHAATVWLPLIVAFFTAVQARRRVAAVGSLVIGYLASVWPPWLIGSAGHASAAFALGLLSGLLALLSTAELIRGARQRRLAQQQIRQQELLRRAGEDRMRMARDLHDVVAHNISVINVQANTALHLMDRQPERAREALSTINDVSRQALSELRSVLGVLRGADESGHGAPRAPSPGMDRLDELAMAMGAAGLNVRIEREGTRLALPAGGDVAAYRIVQEALTNSARHSGGSQATVRITYDADEVEISVDDDGNPAGEPGQAGGTGNGIAGMTERAQASGGWLRAGPRPGGGFRVQARLPAGGGAR
jgi:signal transduction histidine kinase